MQKPRRLMDENSVSFQMFLILLSTITLRSESQISVFKLVLSNTWKSVLFCFLYGGSMRRSQKHPFPVIALHIFTFPFVIWLLQCFVYSEKVATVSLWDRVKSTGCTYSCDSHYK